MALKKIKVLDNATIGEYWRIIQLNNNFDRSDSVVELALYVSKHDRDNGATPIHAYQRALGQAFSDRIFNGSDKVKNIKLSEAYSEIKAQAQADMLKPIDQQDPDLVYFADALDV